MNLIHFSQLSLPVRLLICAQLIGFVCFLTGINDAFSWDSSAPISSYLLWPMSAHGPMSPLIHGLILWSVSQELESMIGVKRFIGFYLGYALILAMVLKLLTMYNMAVGELSSVFSLDIQIVILLAGYFPNRMISFFFLFNMPMKYAGLLFTGMLLYANEGLTIVGKLVSLSPAVFWVIWYLMQVKKAKRSNNSPKGLIYEFPSDEWGDPIVAKANLKQETFYEENRELDQLLKRVAEVGQENLSEREQAKLIEISQKMKERKRK
jgi:hypothetical protein